MKIPLAYITINSCQKEAEKNAGLSVYVRFMFHLGKRKRRRNERRVSIKRSKREWERERERKEVMWDQAARLKRKIDRFLLGFWYCF
jgi:hypothetical protein